MSDTFLFFLLDMAALCLAVRALLLAWFRGGLFDRWRMYFEARGGRLGELVSCPLCLSFWMGAALFALGVWPALVGSFFSPDLGMALRACTGAVVYVPAAATVGWELFGRGEE